MDKYNIFLFDMYGVLWDGKTFYEKALETLKTLKDNGKIVYILSNSSQPNDILKKRITEEHYNGIVTSGDVIKKTLENGEIKFRNKENCEKVYIFGSKNTPIFYNTKYRVVENLDEADFIYISSPQLTEEEYYNYKDDKNIFKKSKNGNWDSVNIKPFIPYLNDYFNKKLPLLSANPDLTAQEIDVNTNEVNFVIRQGTIIEKYKELGGEVFEFGKPNKNIYDFTFKTIEEQIGRKINKNEVIMIGDTLRTDIKGANNVGIDSILLTETGVTANKLRNTNYFELLSEYNVIPTYTIGKIANLMDFY